MPIYFDWNDDEEPLANPSPKEAKPITTALLEPPPKQPMGESVNFRDPYDGSIRAGTIVRSIIASARENQFLGHLPAGTIHLVEYQHATGEDDYTIVPDTLIIRPKKPRS
jgi:hypothetical protein